MKQSLDKISVMDKMCLVLGGLPLLAYGFAFSHLPEEIPSHWDFQGNVDGYSSKVEFSFLAVLPLLLWVMFHYLPKMDPRKENYQKFSGFYQGFQVVMVLFMDLVFFLCLYTAFHPESDWVSKVIPVAVGLLFVFIGNYLPKVKPNYFVGIKTPWTLSSEGVWLKTHRKGGMCFVLLGIFMVVSPFFPRIPSMVFGTVVMMAVFVPVGLSYVYFEQERKGKL